MSADHNVGLAQSIHEAACNDSGVTSELLDDNVVDNTAPSSGDASYVDQSIQDFIRPRRNVLCIYFLSNFGCRNGDKCMYEHCQNPCYEFGMRGWCQKGATCSSVHVDFPTCTQQECNNRTDRRFCIGCTHIYNRSRGNVHVIDRTGLYPALGSTPCRGCGGVAYHQKQYCSTCYRVSKVARRRNETRMSPY